jgi:hypothetical protein
MLSARLRRRLGAERLEVLDRDSRGAFDDSLWRLCSQHDEQAEDGSREEACLLTRIYGAAQLVLAARVAERVVERLGQALEVSLNANSA